MVGKATQNVSRAEGAIDYSTFKAKSNICLFLLFLLIFSYRHQSESRTASSISKRATGNSQELPIDLNFQLLKKIEKNWKKLKKIKKNWKKFGLYFLIWLGFSGWQQTLMGSNSTSMMRISLIYWCGPLVLTMTAVVMETLETGKYPLTGDSTNAANHDGCWLVNHSPWSLGLALVLPVVVLAAITVVTYLKTMAVARGARQLLLTDDQFNHISHCLSFVMKLLPLLTATLLLAVVATLTNYKFCWSVPIYIYNILNSIKPNSTSICCRFQVSMSCSCIII